MNSVRRYGRHALLASPRPPASPLALAAAIRAARHPGVAEVVPAAETVLVVFAAPVRGDDADWLASLAPGERADRGDTVVLDVRYDGDDLEEVARACRLSVGEVVERHSAAQYRCEFCGFAPGFGYLSGLDPRLHLPRRATPRVRVPAGAVAIAGPYSAVYPTASPGGWHLLGRTAAGLWDAQRDPPALIEPGTRVRFRPVSALPARASRQATRPRARGAASLLVVDPGIGTTVQDAGRPGYGSLGVPGAGALDRASHRLVNRLVGNDPAGAAFETAGGLVVEALRPLTLADSATSAVVSLAVGQRLTVHPRRGTSWAYVAVRGGLAVTPVLGSASYDTLSELGPDVPVAGTAYAVGEDGTQPIVAELAPPAPLSAAPVVRIVPGPRVDWYAGEAWTVLAAAAWRIGAQRSRVGVRLDGPPLARADSPAGRELPSEGLVRGAVQVPPDGRPVVMLNDHPVTGGYPVIAVVEPADVELVAQLPVGTPFHLRPAH